MRVSVLRSLSRRTPLAPSAPLAKQQLRAWCCLPLGCVCARGAGGGNTACTHITPPRHLSAPFPRPDPLASSALLGPTALRLAPPRRRSRRSYYVGTPPSLRAATQRLPCATAPQGALRSNPRRAPGGRGGGWGGLPPNSLLFSAGDAAEQNQLPLRRRLAAPQYAQCAIRLPPPIILPLPCCPVLPLASHSVPPDLAPPPSAQLK